MKKITLIIITLLIIQLINAQQTITTYSSGYNSIRGIAINSNNEVYVSEYYTGKVYSIDDNTGSKTEYASTGFYANNIIFKANNDLFITEPYMKKIYIKNTVADATVYLDINFTPHSFAKDSNGDLYVSAGSKIVKINSDLSATDYVTGFLFADSMAFDSSDNLYTVDKNDRKVYKIEPNGTKTVVASYSYENIDGLAIDPNDKVYFTHSIGAYRTDGKILKYDPTTNTVTDFVTTNLDNPRYIAIDDLGNMYVTNLGNETVVKINDDSLLSSTPAIVNIPDPNFKSYLLNLCDTNSDGEVQVTEAVNYTGNIYLYGNTTINSLEGIESFISVGSINFNVSNVAGSINISDFTNLTSLKCASSSIENITISNCPLLSEVKCGQSSLTELNITNTPVLTYIGCFTNQLTNLDIGSIVSLRELRCSGNSITSLDVSNNAALMYLSCDSNDLTSLDISNNTDLTHLSCGSNGLTSLDVNNNTDLTYLSCNSNDLTSLDVNNNTDLTYLSCGSNDLTSLDVNNNTDLTYLACYQNSINSLDVSNNVSLVDLQCSHNPLGNLDVSNNVDLSRLSCSNNQLTDLDLTNNVALTNLWCIINQLPSLDLSNNSQLTSLRCYNNQLTTLNVKNGNNNNFTFFKATNNPDLTCVFVDDVSYSTTNWSSEVDANAHFVETQAECEALSVNNSEIVDFYLYPNPVTNKLIITSATVIKQIELYNSIGQILSKQYNTNNIDVSNLTKGVYYIRISDNFNNKITRKIIKK